MCSTAALCSKPIFNLFSWRLSRTPGLLTRGAPWWCCNKTPLPKGHCLFVLSLCLQPHSATACPGSQPLSCSGGTKKLERKPPINPKLLHLITWEQEQCPHTHRADSDSSQFQLLSLRTASSGNRKQSQNISTMPQQSVLWSSREVWKAWDAATA